MQKPAISRPSELRHNVQRQTFCCLTSLTESIHDGFEISGSTHLHINTVEPVAKFHCLYRHSICGCLTLFAYQIPQWPAFDSTMLDGTPLRTKTGFQPLPITDGPEPAPFINY
jgi:hypothetical protein